MREFERKFGKLIERLSIPVDHKMRAEALEAKSNGFLFNEWAREVLLKHWDQVREFAERKAAG